MKITTDKKFKDGTQLVKVNVNIPLYVILLTIMIIVLMIVTC